MERHVLPLLLCAICLLLPLMLAACRSPREAGRYAVEVTRRAVPLGAAQVHIAAHETGAPGLTFVSMHDDENTAVEAARRTLRQRGGRLVEVQHTGRRNLSFALDSATYTFDPNRIFTDAGAAATLRNLGPFSEEALQATRRFAGDLLAAMDLPTLDAVVTAHNNTEDQYSLRSYAPGGEYVREAAAVYRAPDMDADDFFFVTDRALFDAMRQAGFSAVLQKGAGMTDDGSLSVYCAKQGVPYVNVEAQHGHLDEQVRMMQFLTELLAGSPRASAAR